MFEGTFSFGKVQFNPNKPNGISHPYTLCDSICHLKGARCIFLLFFFYIFVLFEIENSVSKQ